MTSVCQLFVLRIRGTDRVCYVVIRSPDDNSLWHHKDCKRLLFVFSLMRRQIIGIRATNRVCSILEDIVANTFQKALKFTLFSCYK